MRITVLCGGVGGSKLVLGLREEYPNDDITVIGNTADDLEFLGLRISPDLDTVMYTLAGMVNPETGWGLAGDTFAGLTMLERYGQDIWFNLGDRDHATHLVRTALLGSGHTLSEVTEFLRSRLGVRETILPATDSPLATRVRVESGWIGFQEYFVKRRHADQPLEVEYVGADAATISDQVTAAILNTDLLVIAPSNPVVSIGPMLAIPGFERLLKETVAPVIGVSPFIGSSSVTGPADALMAAIGIEGTSSGLAIRYSTFLDALAIHESDRVQVPVIEATGVKACVTETLMPDIGAKRRLARFVVDAGHAHLRTTGRDGSDHAALG